MWSSSINLRHTIIWFWTLVVSTVFWRNWSNTTLNKKLTRSSALLLWVEHKVTHYPLNKKYSMFENAIWGQSIINLTCFKLVFIDQFPRSFLQFFTVEMKRNDFFPRKNILKRLQKHLFTMYSNLVMISKCVECVQSWQKSMKCL